MSGCDTPNTHAAALGGGYLTPPTLILLPLGECWSVGVCLSLPTACWGVAEVWAVSVGVRPNAHLITGQGGGTRVCKRDNRSHHPAVSHKVLGFVCGRFINPPTPSRRGNLFTSMGTGGVTPQCDRDPSCVCATLPPPHAKKTLWVDNHARGDTVRDMSSPS